MRIALISYEYFGFGGIGTYTRNAARMLADRGHSVVVFTGVQQEDPSVDGVEVHQISSVDREGFSRLVVNQFLASHYSRPFDVVEAPEYGAEGAGIARKCPDLPIVTRLHTPTFVMKEIWSDHISTLARLRFLAGAVRRGRVPQRPWAKPDTSGEREAVRASDIVVGPSQSILDLVSGRWGVPNDAQMYVPNVFFAPDELLQLNPGRRRNTVLFLGRLELRKGALDLARAVPRVCAVNPRVQFLFVGKSLPLPVSGKDTREEMQRIIGRWRGNVRFVEAVPNYKISEYFEKADVAAFPSIWESFGYVCLEAMAAGCAVIGSSAGGMAEIIGSGKTGILVQAKKPAALASQIVGLMDDPIRREALGRAARAHVLENYGPEKIGAMQERCYERAILRAKQRTGQVGR